MRTFTAPLNELGEFEEITRLLKKPGAAVALTGCVDSQKLHMVYGLSDGFKYKIIVTFNDIRAKDIYEDYKLYDKNVMLYPAKDLIFYQADIHGNQLVKERMKVLRRIIEGRPLTVVTTFDSLMAPQIPLSVLEQYVVSIGHQSSVNERELAGKLAGMGYEKNYQVEAPGQFSIRGGIVDIFDLTEENPYRIELWGEEVESIRSFDILSQRSIEKLQSVSIYPATELVLSEKDLYRGLEKIEKEAEKCSGKFREEFKTEEAHRLTIQVKELKEQALEFRTSANLESYIRYFYPETVSFMELFDKDKGCFFVDEPARVKEHADAVELEFRESMTHRLEKGYALPGQTDILFGAENVAARMGKNKVVTLAAIDKKNAFFKADKKFDIGARSIASYNNSFDALVKDLKRYRKGGYRVLLLSGSRTRAKRIAQDLREEELTAFYSEDPFREIQPGEVMTFYGRVLKGFEYPLIKFVVISESDIFGLEKEKTEKV